MKILSIDIGIKNLSFCLFELPSPDQKSNQLKIVSWNNIDLSEKSESKCIEIDKNGLCNKSAKFTKDGKCYCLKHSKKHNYLHPSAELKKSYLNKQKIQTLIEIADKYKLNYETPSKKANMLEIINDFINNNCYTAITATNASKVDLVTIGRNIQYKFDEILADHLASIDSIIIENQIGPIANKMKTIQGMISQYFIMRNNNVNVEFISACNKLKDFIPDKKKMDYKQRKKLGTDVCTNYLNNDFRFSEWKDFLQKHTKKDDLSDCFLQGMWYIKYKI
jgi:hypothetical protein